MKKSRATGRPKKKKDNVQVNLTLDRSVSQEARDFMEDRDGSLGGLVNCLLELHLAANRHREPCHSEPYGLLPQYPVVD